MWTGCGSPSSSAACATPLNDLPRRDVEMLDRCVEAGDIARLLLLPDLDAAGVDELGGVALGRAQQPADERLQPLRLALAESPA